MRPPFDVFLLTKKICWIKNNDRGSKCCVKTRNLEDALVKAIIPAPGKLRQEDHGSEPTQTMTESAMVVPAQLR